MNYKTQILESFLRQYDLKEAFTNNLFEKDLEGYKSLMEDEYEVPLWSAILSAFVWFDTKEGANFWKTVNDLWFENVVNGFTAKEARSSFRYNRALLRFEEFKSSILQTNQEAWADLLDHITLGEIDLNMRSYGEGCYPEELLILMLMGDEVSMEDVLYTLLSEDKKKEPVWCGLLEALCTTGFEEPTDE